MRLRGGLIMKDSNFVPTNRKIWALLRSILIIFVGIIIMIILFFWCIHPMITYHFSHPAVDTDLSIFSMREYINYENGELFEDFLSLYSFAEDGDAVAFYHVDNQILDNPIHGKMPDVFSVDVRYDNLTYRSIVQNALVEFHFDKVLPCDDYELYLIEDGFHVYCIGVCNKESILRFTMVTELESCTDFTGVIFMHTSLDFDVP